MEARAALATQERAGKLSPRKKKRDRETRDGLLLEGQAISGRVRGQLSSELGTILSPI